VERLAFLEEGWPDAKEVELLGVWAGNPPRLEAIARARVRGRWPMWAVDALSRYLWLQGAGRLHRP
jgi:hypothetical protein